MKSLYLRIYLTLVGLLLAFVVGASWLAERHLSQEREKNKATQDERMRTTGALLAQSLPPPDAPVEEQAAAMRSWSQKLRMPMALQAPDGKRLAITPRFRVREERGDAIVNIPLDDGRALLLMRPPGPPQRNDGGLSLTPGWLAPQLARFGGSALVSLFALLFVGVALGAYPVVRVLTRRLEALKAGVERFGSGELSHRVEAEGKDEIAALAKSFNQSAERVNQLLSAHQSLLANASHELRSPLARLKMALQLRDNAAPVDRERLDAEIKRNLTELDGLVDEVLLSSRLQGQQRALQKQPVDVLGLIAEEAAALDIPLEPLDPGTPSEVQADERLLRRAVRNLLENAKRYGGVEQSVALCREGVSLQIKVLDRGPGVPIDLVDRIFEPFFRLPGHAEVAGGVGLGLALVKQIASAHGGQVSVQSRPAGGSVFVLALPLPPNS